MSKSAPCKIELTEGNVYNVTCTCFCESKVKFFEVFKGKKKHETWYNHKVNESSVLENIYLMLLFEEMGGMKKLKKINTICNEHIGCVISLPVELSKIMIVGKN